MLGCWRGAVNVGDDNVGEVPDFPLASEAGELAGAGGAALAAEEGAEFLTGLASHSRRSAGGSDWGRRRGGWRIGAVPPRHNSEQNGGTWYVE